ncbi:unnamed protein product, partial [Durusdinium trenchii]
ASSASSIRAGMPIRAAPVKEVKPKRRSGEVSLGSRRVRPLAERLEAHVEVAMRRAKEQWQQQQIEAEERRKVSFIIRLQAMQRGRFARQRVQKLQCQSAAAELLQAAQKLKRRDLIGPDVTFCYFGLLHHFAK